MEKVRFFWLGMGLVCHSSVLGRGPLTDEAGKSEGAAATI